MSLVSAICLGGPFAGQEFEIETSPAVSYLSGYTIQQEMALREQDCVTYAVEQVNGDWVLRWPA